MRNLARRTPFVNGMYTPGSIVRSLCRLPCSLPINSIVLPRLTAQSDKQSYRFFLKMGIFKHFRSKSKPDGDEPRNVNGYKISGPLAPNHTSRLNPQVLKRIFTFVCPHTLDDSYQNLDDVDLGDNTCMLCNLRDLAQCARVCKAWHSPATELMYVCCSQGVLSFVLTLTRYGSIRIDSIHYCEREEELRQTRAKKNRRSFRKSHVYPDDDYIYDPATDPTNDRMKLLADTLRSNYWLGSQVKYLKLAYTIRESMNRDLTRTVGVCPNLRYVDLPHGFFSGESRFDTLRHELWANCPDIRTMKYLEGSERFLRDLGEEPNWKNLEILTLEHIRIDIGSFRYIIASLPRLTTLILNNLPDISDDIFSLTSGVSEFPALKALELHELPRVTASGLIRYFMSSQVRDSLSNLTLDDTGVQLSRLHLLLAAATRLQSLTITQTVNTALPLDPLPPLQSPSLQALHFEIQNAPDNVVSPPPADSYHHYLMNSITGGGFPNLRAIYVRDPSFPEELTHSHHKPGHSPVKQADSMFGYGDSPTLPRNPAEFDGATGLSSLGIDVFSPPRSSSVQNPPLLNNRPRPRRRTFNAKDSPPVPQVPPQYRYSQPLEVYTKGQHEKEWLFAPMRPPSSHHASPNLNRTWSQRSATTPHSRPVSVFNAGWAAGARRSVVVADGEGGFLNVPDDPLPERPVTGGGVSTKKSEFSAPAVGSTVTSVNGSPRVGEEWEDADSKRMSKRGSWWASHVGMGKSGSKSDIWR
jgi:hypothetical protein